MVMIWGERGDWMLLQIAEGDRPGLVSSGCRSQDSGLGLVHGRSVGSELPDSKCSARARRLWGVQEGWGGK